MFRGLIALVAAVLFALAGLNMFVSISGLSEPFAQALGLFFFGCAASVLVAVIPSRLEFLAGSDVDPGP